jgi:hypothetical protein
MQNIPLKSALTGLFLLGSMGLANAAGSGMEARQDVSQMRGYTAQADLDHLYMGRSVSTGNARSNACQLPEPSVSPNGIASLSQMAVCR